MEALTLPIFIGAALLIVSALSSLISYRIGAPLLLVFLGVGLLAGEGGLGLRFDDAPLAYTIGSTALAVILFESGFGTRWSAYRQAAAPAIAAATLGVVLTASVLGIAAKFALDVTWAEGLLLGAIIGSTDAAAVFFLLRTGGIRIRDRVRSTLEIESGTNDPMAIFLTISLVEYIAFDQQETAALGDVFLGFFVQMGGGLIAGALGGLALKWVVNRLRLEPGLGAVFVLSASLLVFATTSLIGASGFLAAYVAGLVVGNGQLHGLVTLRRFHDGLTWLSQIIMFVTLGLLASPSQFPDVAIPALLLALCLMFVARPIAIWLCLAPFHFSPKETSFVAWVGLRGAVSILLAILPIIGGLEIGRAMFNVVFLIVLVSLLIQGWTITPVARRLGLVVPGRSGPENRMELELPGQAHYELVSYVIHPQSPVARGQRVPRWARPSLIVRKGVVQTIHTVGALDAGDLVYLFATPARLPLLDRLYAATHDIAEEDRAFFGDLALRGDTTLGAVAETYGLPLPAERWSWTLRDLFAREYRRPDVGDRLTIGAVELVVRTLDEVGVKDVGLVLEPMPVKPPPFIFNWPTALCRRLREPFHRLSVVLRQRWRRDR